MATAVFARLVEEGSLALVCRGEAPDVEAPNVEAPNAEATVQKDLPAVELSVASHAQLVAMLSHLQCQHSYNQVVLSQLVGISSGCISQWLRDDCPHSKSNRRAGTVAGPVG